MAAPFLKSLRAAFQSITAVPQWILDGGFLSRNASGGIGYSDGAGGTVTQATSKVTAFTLNAATGRIVTAGGALAAWTSSSATWTNSALGSYDVVVFNQDSGTLGAYEFTVTGSNGQGQFVIANTSSTSLTEAVAVRFTIIKGTQS